ncbi:MAG: AAA family ATPase [Clostridiales bacterium]|nr:MAG: AAA family ATPase [Clostridiales bacterium]
MNEKTLQIKKEICKAIIGKDDVVEKVLTAIIAGGHILLEDIPGVGKTTLALAFSKTMGLEFKRMQFTPDVVPSDITGFTIYNEEKRAFEYKEGAVICNFFLADEINRTSSKTQSSLLEVMQEGKVTIDGEEHFVPQPFIVMATQNPLGTAGTQMLPEAQLDRFMIRLSMGYPNLDAQIKLMKDRAEQEPLSHIQTIADGEMLVKMKNEAKSIFMDDKIYRYIATLSESTRDNEFIKLGISPRGALAMCSMAKAAAFVKGRDYVVPEDVLENINCTWDHRIILNSKAYSEKLTEDLILSEITANNKALKI